MFRTWKIITLYIVALLMTTPTLASVTPQEALDKLKAGNLRYVNDNPTHQNYKSEMHALKNTQSPFAIVLNCMDSRQTPEVLFDQGLGNLLVLRVAGNVLNQDILGSMELGAAKMGARLIVVLGHTDCGAIKGACSNLEFGQITPLLNRIQESVQTAQHQMAKDCNSSTFINTVARDNVKRVVNSIRARSEILSELIASGKVMVVGGLYDVGTGTIDWIDTPATSR